MPADLASALAARDPVTAAHSARVAFLADRLAAWLGWDDGRLGALRFGAALHDVGKLAVSTAILRKRGPLDAAELAEVRAHPAAGAKLIRDGDARAREALPLVLYHHERWDGCGYPTGLAGETIPEEARLLAVADAFDAMTTTRPYRRARAAPRALREIERCAGTQFDPTFANAFLEAWHAGALASPSAASG